MGGGDLASTLERDQLYPHVRPDFRGGLQHLEGSDGVELVEAVEDHDRDSHRRTLTRLERVALEGATKAELARLLREAQDAHSEYEKELGRRDEDWPSWYAGLILDQLRRREQGPDA